MPKKLMMNNGVDEDAIILCENYSPNGQPFYLWQDKMIDWDKYELYINVDISNITRTWQKILTISSADIISWGGEERLHLYGSPNRIRIQPIKYNVNTAPHTRDFSLASYNKEKIQITVNKNGVYLEEELVVSSTFNALLQEVINVLKTANVTIGSASPGDYSVCTYNLVCLRKYQERGGDSVR